MLKLPSGYELLGTTPRQVLLHSANGQVSLRCEAWVLSSFARSIRIRDNDGVEDDIKLDAIGRIEAIS
jgi:hypothetical protein